MLEMLDSDGGLNIGKFKLPLYGKEYNPYVIYQTGIPYKSEFTFICVEIAAAYEPSQRKSASLVEQFVIPKMHLQKQRKDVLEQLRQKEFLELKLIKLEKDKLTKGKLLECSDDKFAWEEIKPDGQKNNKISKYGYFVFSLKLTFL